MKRELINLIEREEVIRRNLLRYELSEQMTAAIKAGTRFNAIKFVALVMDYNALKAKRIVDFVRTTDVNDQNCLTQAELYADRMEAEQ